MAIIRVECVGVDAGGTRMSDDTAFTQHFYGPKAGCLLTLYKGIVTLLNSLEITCFRGQAILLREEFV